MMMGKQPKLLLCVHSLAALLLSSSLAVSDSGEPNGNPTLKRRVGDYAAHSLLRIEFREPRLITRGNPGTAEDPHEFERYRRTQATLIRSPFVLNAALKFPGISELDLVKQHDDPTEWLASNVDVTFPDDCEILRISLRGDNPVELKAIVDAVTNAYLREVVESDRNKQVARVAHLERIASEFDEKSRIKRHQLGELARRFGIVDTSVLDVKQRIAIEHNTYLRRELTRVNLELIKARIEQSTQEKATASPTRDSVPKTVVSDQVEADSKVTQLRDRVAQLQETIDILARSVINKERPQLRKFNQDLEVAEQALESHRANARLAVLEKRRGMAEEHSRVNALQLDRTLEVLNAQRELLQTELEEERREIEKSATITVDVQMLRDEIAEISKVRNGIRAQMEALGVEIQAPSRVTLLQNAQVSRVKK